MNSPSPSSPRNTRERRLKAVMAEYTKRRDAGELIDKAALLRDYPDLADDLRLYFQRETPSINPALAVTKLGPHSVASNLRDTIAPGEMQQATASEFSARMFGRYQLLRPLGEGAMGNVYLASDSKLDRQVALKVPKPAVADKDEFLTRFMREARAAAGLKHPHICSVFDAGEVDGVAYITMDFIDGVTLSQLIATRKLQSVESILTMIRTIADAVEHAHQKGVIHRDLKPGNILVDDHLAPFVTDFGLARRTAAADESRITREGLLIGTPAYMAPEQVRGEQEKVGIPSDIYSLGVIMFELLTGQLPFDGRGPEMLAKVLRDNPPVPSRMRNDLPEDVDDVVLKMLQKEPTRRYGSMHDVIAAIDKLASKLKTAETIAGQTCVTEQAKSPYEIQKAHVQLMLNKGQYATAIQELEILAREKHAGAKEVAVWAQKKLPGVRAEAKALSPAGIAAMQTTAQQLFDKSDYQGCMQLLEDVPSLKRTEEMEQLRRKAQQRETESEQLLDAIREKESRQNPEGLEPLVRKFLKLKPGNAYAKRLWQALQTYSSTPGPRRYYRFEKGRLQPMPEPSLFARWLVLAALVGVLTFLSVSYYIIIYLKSGNQTLAVYVDDEWLRNHNENLTLAVDGTDYTISAGTPGKESLLVTVSLGEHAFSVRHGDTVVHHPKMFEIEKDGRRVLQITATDISLLNSVPQELAGRKADDSPTSGMAATDRSTQTDARQAGSAAPWITLFDGSDVGGWSSLGPFKVEQGLLIANDGRANAVSKGQFSDFELEAEWKIDSHANGGIYYRDQPFEGVRAGNEYQIIDGGHPGIKELSHRSGALYGVFPGNIAAERSLGEWNKTRIVCRGSQVEHWLNDQEVLAYDTSSPEFAAAIQSSRITTGKEQIGSASRGHILLQSQTGEIAFRTIRIRELNSSVSDVLKPPGPTQMSVVTNSRFSVINNASADDVLAWSRSLPKDFLPSWHSLRGNSPIPVFDARATYRTDLKKWKLEVVDADDESFEQPQLKGYLPANIVTFQDQGKIRSLCLAVDTMRPWNFWSGSTPFVQQKISDAQTTKSRMGDRDWGNIPLFVSSNHWRQNWGYYLITAPMPPFENGELISPLTEAQLMSTLQIARQEGKQPHIINLIQNGKTPAEYFVVLWQRNETPMTNWSVSLNLDFESYRSLLDKVSETEASPRCVFSAIQNGQVVYNVLWDELSDSQLQNLGVKPLIQPVAATEPPTAAIAPFSSEQAKRSQESWAASASAPVEESNSIGMKFRLIPPGEFMMGSPESEHLRQPNEGPQHRVRISQPFRIGATEVTQAQWVAVMKTRPWQGQPNVIEGDDIPATHVSWNEAVEFCNKLGVQEGKVYRLPTEAEWEYACRAGTTTAYYFGDDIALLHEHAWFDVNTAHQGKNSAQPVATRKPNPFGLFDMHGNVFEWCQDFFTPSGYPEVSAVAIDPNTQSGGDLRITRGVSWDWSGFEHRSAYRGAAGVDFRSERDGFRVVQDFRHRNAGMSAASDVDSHGVTRADGSVQPATAPFSTDKALRFQDAWAAYLKVPTEFTNSIGMKFRLIPPGAFTIGSTLEQIEAAKPELYKQYPDRTQRADSEWPQQVVTLTRPFYLGVTEVTQSQYEMVMGVNPSGFPATESDKDRSNAPVEMVSWMSTGIFCDRLSSREGVTSAYNNTPQMISQTGTGGYRLPTEAEWEYACRAGTTTLFWSGDDEGSLAKVAWYAANNESGKPKPVAMLPANPFGLHDMHGNVWEWVHDAWRPDTYQLMKDAGAVDPRCDTGPDFLRVMRGGDHFLSAAEARAACRDCYGADTVWTDVGFRTALSVDAVRQLLVNTPPPPVR